MERGHHDLVRERGGWRCTRCGLTPTPAQRAKAARTRCPVPMLLIGGVAADPGASAHLSRITSLARRWLEAQRGRAPPGDGARAEGPLPPPPPAPAAGPPAAPAGPEGGLFGPLRLRWLPHLAVAHGNRPGAACLRCGGVAPRNDPRRLHGTACGGEVARLPGRVLQDLVAGSFDQALAEATVATVARARALGWRPLHRPPGPGLPRDGRAFFGPD